MLKLYEESTVQALADGVRALTGETGTFTLAEMAETVADYWGSSDLLLSSVYADGTPWDKYEGYRWGTTNNIVEAAAGDPVRYSTGYITLPAHHQFRLRLSQGDIRVFFVEKDMKSSERTDGFYFGNTEQVHGVFKSLIWDNTSDSTVYIRICATAPISSMKAKTVSGVTA